MALVIGIMKELQDARLYIAGEGPQEAMLRDLARKLGVISRVHFLGSLHGADVARFYKAVDLLLMPSIYEGHPMVMLEAMSAGVPIIANDIPVFREAGGDAPAYCKPHPAIWRATISALTMEDQNRMVVAGRDRAAAFAAVSMVDRYLEVAGLPSRKMEPQCR